MLDACILPIN